MPRSVKPGFRYWSFYGILISQWVLTISSIYFISIFHLNQFYQSNTGRYRNPFLLMSELQGYFYFTWQCTFGEVSWGRFSWLMKIVINLNIYFVVGFKIFFQYKLFIICEFTYVFLKQCWIQWQCYDNSIKCFFLILVLSKD